MNKKEIAKRINVTIPTLYNWEKNNSELYKAIFLVIIPKKKIIQWKVSY